MAFCCKSMPHVICASTVMMYCVFLFADQGWAGCERSGACITCCVSLSDLHPSQSFYFLNCRDAFTGIFIKPVIVTSMAAYGKEPLVL